MNLQQYGFTRRSLPTPTGRMTVFEAGTGTPLLLLHGIGGGASSMYWFRLGPLLARRFRIIAPDWVGWGESEHPRREILFDDYVEQMVALSADVGEPTLVVAQSLAAGFALEAGNRGAQIVKMAMLAPSGGRDFGIDAFGPVARNALSRVAAVPGVNELLYRLVFHSRAFIRMWFDSRGFYDADAVPAALVDSSVFSARQPNAACSALPFLSGSLRYDLAPFLQATTIPSLMLWGSGERQISPHIRNRLETVNPAIPVRRIDGARSSLEVEQPERTREILEDFFAD